MGAKFDLSKIKGIGAPEQNNQKGAVGAGLLNMASKAQAAVNRATIYVPYEKIIPNEKNGMSLKDIDELAQLIELAGLQQPLVVKELEDEYIVLPVGERTEEVNEVISLSETAGFIYIHADQAEDIEELAQLVGNEYGIEASEVYEDVKNVVKTFREKGILL